MDRNRFDALTRLLGAEGSRRTALGTVLGAAILGNSLGSAAKKKNKNKKKRRRRRNRNQETCFGTLICEFPSDGQDFEDCNLAGTDISNCNGCNFRDADLGDADLSNGSYQGASFREANLRGADLNNADLSGASFRDACLVNAIFEDANVDGAHFRGAILCNTMLSDGSIDNSGCDRVDDCCVGPGPTCPVNDDCPPGLTCCLIVCVDLENDNFNCGSCENVCDAATPHCVQGICVA